MKEDKGEWRKIFRRRNGGRATDKEKISARMRQRKKRGGNAKIKNNTQIITQ